MKLKITTKRLTEMGVDIVDFVKNGPAGAIYDAAKNIGDEKGWGSEGSGELMTDFMNELGFYSDKETCEDWCDLEEGDEVLLDGVDVRVYDVHILEARQLMQKLENLEDEKAKITTRLNEIFPGLTYSEIKDFISN